MLMLVGLLIATAITPRSVLGVEGRTLGGYRFIPAARISDPFITTHFGNTVGVSVASDINVPVVLLDTTPPDTLFSLQGNLLFVRAVFGFQYAFNPIVTARIRAAGASRVGTSGEAMLSQGVSVLTDFGLGTTIKLWEREDILVSGTADVGSGAGLLVDLVQFAEEVIENGPENASVVRTVDGVLLDAGLSAAWAINHYSGVTATGLLGYHSMETRREDLAWRLATSGSVDFGQNDKAPVGLLLFLDWDNLTVRSAAAGTAFSLGGGVFYTGREDLNLGLEITWSRFTQVTRDVKINPISFDLVLKYFF